MDRKYCLIVLIVSKLFMHRKIQINMKMIYLRSVKKQNLNLQQQKGGNQKVSTRATRTMYLWYLTYMDLLNLATTILTLTPNPNLTLTPNPNPVVAKFKRATYTIL